MSDLVVDTLQGATSAGSITVVGEGGVTETNLQQGLAKAWVSYNQSTAAVNDSVNIASVTDNSTGNFTINYSNNMSNTNYANQSGTWGYSGSATRGGVFCGRNFSGTAAVGATDCYQSAASSSTSNAVAGDYEDACISTLGDLA